MRYIIFSLLFLSAILSAFTTPNNLIDWNASRKLTWNDFKGQPDGGSAGAALTSTNISFSSGYTDNKLTFHVHCQFDKNRSWVNIKNDYILSHEQLHFDIAELHARKLGALLRAYKLNASTFKSDMSEMNQKTIAEMEDMQNQYDNETNYSRDKTKQEEWSKKIAAELERTKSLANYQ